MKKRILSLILILALATSAFAGNMSAARNHYVKKLSIRTKKITLQENSEKKIKYNVIIKGKVSKKISLKVKNKKIVKASVKKGKIILAGKGVGKTKVIITTKGKNAKRKRISKTILVNVVNKETNKSNKKSLASPKANPAIPSSARPTEISTFNQDKPNDMTEIIAPGENTYSRAEWVSKLADKLRFNTSSEIDENLYYFSDTAGEHYGSYAELAKAYDLLPECDAEGYEDEKKDLPLFEGDKPVTKEYATYTIVKALGFIPDEQISLSCGDKEDLKYPIIDGIAVEQNITSLDLNQNFCPQEILTRQEADKLLDKIDEFEKTTQIDTNKEIESIEYEKDVVLLNNLTEDVFSLEDINGSRYLVRIRQLATEELSVDDIFVLPATNEYVSGSAFCVKEVEKSDGYYSYVCTKPQLDDIVSHITYAGEGETDIENIKTAEGVQVSYIEDEDSEGIELRKKAGGSIKVPGKLSFTLGNKKISDKLKVSGKIEISMPDVTCKMDADIGLGGVSFNEFVVSMTEKIKIKSDLTYDQMKNTKWEKGNVEIGRVPVRLGATGLSFDIIFFFNISANGKASIAYTIQATNGFQYINGSPRVIKDYTQSYEELNLSGSFKAGLGISLALDAFGLVDLCAVDFSAGLGVKATFTRHTDVSPELCCGDGMIYLYADCTLSKEAALGKFLDKVCRLSWSADIYNEKNSKFKVGIHIENDQKVEECTYGTGSIEGTVTDSDNNTINRVRIQIYHDDEILVKTLYTDNRGKFVVTGLSPGKYKVVISKTGYRVYTTEKSVEKGKVSYIGTITMIERDGTETDAPEGNLPKDDESINNPRVADGVTTWDCIYFGSYWQNDTNGDGKADENDEKEPIKWRVLSLDGNRAVLLADKCLDSQPYNDSGKTTTWAESSIRNWLSTTFMNRAFQDNERVAIKESRNQNDNNPPNDSFGDPISESDTSDLIYLLSIEQVCNEEYGFTSAFREMSDSRIAYNTEFASEIENAWNGNNKEGTWYLRTPTKFYFISSVANVSYGGQGAYYDGMHGTGDVSSIRPAIQLDLSDTEIWKHAGTVSSDGTETGGEEDGDKKILKAGDCYKFVAQEDANLYVSGDALCERRGMGVNNPCFRESLSGYIPMSKGKSLEFKVISGSLEFQKDDNILIEKIDHDPMVKIVLNGNKACRLTTTNSIQWSSFEIGWYCFDSSIVRTYYKLNGEVSSRWIDEKRTGLATYSIDGWGSWCNNTLEIENLEGTTLVYISWYDYVNGDIIIEKGELATEEELEKIYKNL